jgi:hypothetical protein
MMKSQIKQMMYTYFLNNTNGQMLWSKVNNDK